MDYDSDTDMDFSDMEESSESSESSDTDTNTATTNTTTTTMASKRRDIMFCGGRRCKWPECVQMITNFLTKSKQHRYPLEMTKNERQALARRSKGFWIEPRNNKLMKRVKEG